VPPDTLLTERYGEIPAWDEIADDMKPVLVKQMEVYAGFLEHVDHHLGQLVDGLADLEILDNTLIYYILGDIIIFLVIMVPLQKGRCKAPSTR
jgi:arylsulfatase